MRVFRELHILDDIFLWRFLFPLEMQVISSECVSWHSKVHAKLVISVISPASIWFFLLYFFPESHNCELEATKKKENVDIPKWDFILPRRKQIFLGWLDDRFDFVKTSIGITVRFLVVDATESKEQTVIKQYLCIFLTSLRCGTLGGPWPWSPGACPADSGERCAAETSPSCNHQTKKCKIGQYTSKPSSLILPLYLAELFSAAEYFVPLPSCKSHSHVVLGGNPLCHLRLQIKMYWDIQLFSNTSVQHDGRNHQTYKHQSMFIDVVLANQLLMV